ncbi:NAD(P)H-dependent oxidoreductase subunit E [Deinococcus peraridilitoris]|uniref:NAD(P)H-dependent oxidoreductase subunit E n=1 Tax=Deinococcus peraridilitoris TaxID=432329 RepID=UPI0002DADA63|nr:NAD(P)H-dependent oxidoreductase subunit E [Deinococcus peraridilitoris]
MSVHRIEICTDGLDHETREQLLEVVWSELRISPGMVSADGNFELLLSRCAEGQEEAPLVKLNGALFVRVTPDRLADLIRRRRR